MIEPGIYIGRPKDGFHIYSSSGCGDDCAIRMKIVEEGEKTVSYEFDTKFARELAKILIEVSDNYDKGVETGIY